MGQSEAVFGLGAPGAGLMSKSRALLKQTPS